MVNEVRLKNGIVCTPDKSVKWMAVRKLPVIVGGLRMLEDFEVDTLEGTHQGRAGDYLLKGVKGELYPVRKDIFEETYEVLKDEVKAESLTKCRHPYSKCRFMIGLAKKYRKPPSERKCGVADPDTICKPSKDAQASVKRVLEVAPTKSSTPHYKCGACNNLRIKDAKS